MLLKSDISWWLKLYLCKLYRKGGGGRDIFDLQTKDVHFNFAVTSFTTAMWDEQNWVTEDFRVQLLKWFKNLILWYSFVLHGNGTISMQLSPQLQFVLWKTFLGKRNKQKKDIFSIHTNIFWKNYLPKCKVITQCNPLTSTWEE